MERILYFTRWIRLIRFKCNYLIWPQEIPEIKTESQYFGGVWSTTGISIGQLKLDFETDFMIIGMHQNRSWHFYRKIK